MKNSRPLILALVLFAVPAWASADLCESAALRAAEETGVPADVVLAIALTETGRRQDGRMRPWPWTANAEGQGHWFDSRTEAAAFARQLLARGQTLFDLGCFQINWRWHGENFRAPEDLLDPLTAARYAARLLAQLHDELGSWEQAAGAYHSRTPEHAARYRARFAQLRAGLRIADVSVHPRPTAAMTVARDAAPGLRDNTFALLAGAASGASLVPAALPAARPLFERRP